MKYAVWGLIASVAVVLTFQNCKSSSSTSDIVSLTSVFKINLALENPEFVVLYFNEIQTVQKAAGNYQVKSRVSLKIDLAGGHIEKTSDVSPQPVSYCLSEEKRLALSAMLASFQICKTRHEVSKDEMCTMQYTYPYAEIITPREKFELGFAANGCPTETVDLCDGQDAILKEYIENLKNTYQPMDCPY